MAEDNKNVEVETAEQEVHTDEQEGTQESAEQEAVTFTDDDVLNALDNPSDAVKAKLAEIVQAAVKKALSGNTPRRTTVKTAPISKSDFANMSYSEREKLFNENRSLYNELNK